ncbi:O-Glycosyl hydrolases family 17 protein [Hibiscus syriacus]|uniref:O-Glycosyl hydrolases family 17 protein n=1 Tax=Hibiscus syriacus TaxID=106335 RepID=A0A6A3A9R3_HIBSY|nr:O-Glycosyl hydrolases family 17 protein [Hibiscus syriacus]
MQKPEEHEGRDCYGDNDHVGFQETNVGFTNSGYETGTCMTHFSVETICTNPNSCCFPSTMPGISTKQRTDEVGCSEVSRSKSDNASSHTEQSNLRGLETNKSRLSSHSMFKLLNGRIVSCSIYSRAGIHEFSSILTDDANQDDISSSRGPLLSQKSRTIRMERNKVATKQSSFHGLPSPNMYISSPVMDWGHKYLFLPSVGYLTVANTCNESILHIYEPFSTNLQFYPCNFSEVLLGPGEVASICFVFLPRWVGFTSAHLILQTSSGGFLVQAKGFAVESPYEIQALIGLCISSSQELSKNLSLFNPFDVTLYVEEITSWISISLGNTTQHTGAVCSIENFQGYNEHNLLSADDWLVMNSGNAGFPLGAMSLNRNWVIKPKSSETIIEIDLSPESKGRILGAFCMQLLRSSQDMVDIVMVPLEADLHRKSSYDDPASSVSVSLDAMMVPYDGNGAVFVAISLKNSAPYVLNVVKISEVANTKVFHIKHMEGLLLFPGAVTKVAVITCTKLPDENHDSASEVSNLISIRKFLIMTNESISPKIEVSCEDILQICMEHKKDPSMAYKHHSERAKFDIAWMGSFGDGIQLASWTKAAEADELVLQNWKTQGTSGGMTVLDENELLFPMVQDGSHFSKWITVTNPSKQPVIMQLILNSGGIVDECRSQDDFIKLRSGSLVQNSSIVPIRFGFSMRENALTEAYAQPYGRASFGTDRGLLSMAILVSAPLLFLVLCFLVHQEMVLGSRDYFFKSEGKNSITTIRTGGKSSRANRIQRNSKFPVSAEMDGLLSSVGDTKSLKDASNGRYPNSQVRTKGQELTGPNAKITPENDWEPNSILDPERETSLQSLPSKSAVTENLDIKEAPQAGYLSIRIEKEKVRRRRKRKGGFRELIEVSGNQSGNSTPSSPLSPITSVLPNRKWSLCPVVDQSAEARNPFSQLADQCCEKGQVFGPISEENLLAPKVSGEHGSNNWYSSIQEQSTLPRKIVPNSVFLPSTISPCPGRATPSMLSSSFPLSSTSVIAPSVRAPGPKLSDQKTINAERKCRLRDEYTYNIWGDHFSGLHIMGSSKDVTFNSSTTESDPESFFARGPLTFMKKI